MSSGSICQFFKVPLTRPEITMNSKTRTLIHVKTLFTIADSLTPNASRPYEEMWNDSLHRLCITICQLGVCSGEISRLGEHMK